MKVVPQTPEAAVRTRRVVPWAGALVLGVAGAAGAQEEEPRLSFALGAGAAYEAEYPGADEYDTRAIPFVAIGWDLDNRFGSSVSFEGDQLDLTVFEGDRLALGLGLGHGGGRDAEDAAILAGLPDIDDGPMVELFAGYAVNDALSFGAALTSYTEGAEGLGASVGAALAVPLSGRAFVEVGLGTTYTDDDRAAAFFGVTPVQAAASTAGLTPYEADGGFTSVDLTVDLGYAFTERRIGLASVGATKLIGNAEDSPFTEDDVNPSFAAGLIHEF